MLLKMTSAEFRDYISKMPDNTMLVVEFDTGEGDGVNQEEMKHGEEEDSHDE